MWPPYAVRVLAVTVWQEQKSATSSIVTFRDVRFSNASPFTIVSVRSFVFRSNAQGKSSALPAIFIVENERRERGGVRDTPRHPVQSP